MAVFKEMDPELAWKAIEGYEDELSPEANKLEAFYRQHRCPRCKTDSLRREADVRHAFSDAEVAIPRSLLRCITCELLLDPFSGLVVESGNPAKMPTETIPIIGE